MEQNNQPLRYNYTKCENETAEKMVGFLKIDSRFSFKSEILPTEKSHFLRYNFLMGKVKIVIVYDIKAHIFSLTTKSEVIEDVKAVLEGKTQLPETVVEVLPEYKNGFSIKKCPLVKLEGILKLIKGLESVTIQIEPTSFAGTAQETKTYEIADKNKQKLKLRYMPKKQSLQLQGKRSNLFGEVQVLLCRDTEYLEAVGSHIELTGEEKRAGEIHKELKKLMPDAVSYLSEQSKIDFSIGMIDINSEVKLSDYSVLLVPPYRGLERFIYDLQVAQGISVKMIGQAYEKDDSGNYMLKIGYRKKIGSVIYNEVMSAMYIEYFARRNFYAHSDNSLESQVRRIEDKEIAKKIFNDLCAVINYNCKKLKEIGFTIKEVQ